MSKYQIFTDSCSELSTELRKKYHVDYLHMGLVVDGEEKRADLDWIDYTPEEFYGWLIQGKKVKTTQVSMKEFDECFRPYLEKGIDILYLSCSSALSSSIHTLEIVKEDLLKEFPDRKIIGVDTLLGACVEGMCVLDAASQQQKGLTIEECAQWVLDNRFKYNQFATVDNLSFLSAAGRIKTSKAILGNLFHKKPIFISDRKGNNYTIMTVTGTKNADKEMIDGVKNTIDKNNCSRVVIGYGMDKERALALQNRIKEEVGVTAEIWRIGPIVGTTCGPTIMATQCFGKEVTRFDGE